MAYIVEQCQYNQNINCSNRVDCEGETCRFCAWNPAVMAKRIENMRKESKRIAWEKKQREFESRPKLVISL